MYITDLFRQNSHTQYELRFDQPFLVFRATLSYLSVNASGPQEASNSVKVHRFTRLYFEIYE